MRLWPDASIFANNISSRTASVGSMNTCTCATRLQPLWRAQKLKEHAPDVQGLTIGPKAKVQAALAQRPANACRRADYGKDFTVTRSNAATSMRQSAKLKCDTKSSQHSCHRQCHLIQRGHACSCILMPQVKCAPDNSNFVCSEIATQALISGVDVNQRLELTPAKYGLYGDSQLW